MNRRSFLRLCALSTTLFSTGVTVAESPRVLPLVEKRTLSLASFSFQHKNRALPVKIGYETYGQLNKTRDNAILVCHYFAGYGHAAGKYKADDKATGWWDSLIGPGKAIDTDKYFVVSSDIICNLNAFNPNVITTGPASIDPKTGREYALDFPILSLRDIVGVQRELVRHLGISSLKMVTGPSLGGLQSFAWARYFPEVVESIMPVISLPMIRPQMLMNPGQLAIDAIKLDPRWNNGNYYGGEHPYEGLMLAFKTLLLSVNSDPILQKRYGRMIADPNRSPYEFFDGKFKVDQALEDIVAGRLSTFDPNAYIYLSKAVTLFDLRKPGQELKDALGEIKTPTLMINDASDLMFGPEQSKRAASLLSNAELFLYDSGTGHLSGVFETHRFEGKVRAFLNSRA